MDKFNLNLAMIFKLLILVSVVEVAEGMLQFKFYFHFIEIVLKFGPYINFLIRKW